MIRLRPATLADIPLLRHWDTQPHVRAAVANDGWRWETELAANDWSESFIAELDGRPLGFVQVMDPAGDPAVTGILIDPLASNTRAHRFYERLGFEFVEDVR